MKKWIGLVVLAVSLKGWAGDFVPSLHYLVKPAYPQELERVGLPGEVRAKFKVNADGSVVDPKILYSTHPEFAGAVLKVVREWQFASWTPGNGNPQQVEILSPLVFSLNDSPEARGRLQGVDLAGATCRKHVEEIHRFERRNLKMPLGELTLFMVARSRLIDLYVAQDLTLEQLSEALYELSQGMEKISRTCEKKRGSRFVDTLPEGVKDLLARSLERDHIQVASEML